jgi:hypothetical protein
MKKEWLLNMTMSVINMADNENVVEQREAFEFNKYGRRLHQEAAAHPHFYNHHSIHPKYGNFDRQINEPNQ